jgi:hypothetical protein
MDPPRRVGRGDRQEDRAELVFAEDLQQQFAGFAVDQDVACLQLGYVFAVARDAFSGGR